MRSMSLDIDKMRPVSRSVKLKQRVVLGQTTRVASPFVELDQVAPKSLDASVVAPNVNGVEDSKEIDDLTQ
jgi:hypothetical protein